MKDVTVGQFYPADSLIHRLDPRTKIIAVVVYMVAIFFIKTFVGYGIAAACLLTIIFVSRVPLGSVLRSLRGILFLVLFTTVLNIFFYKGTSEEFLCGWWVFNIYSSGIISASKLALRLLLLVIGPSLLTLTTSPVTLTDGMESLLSPLRLIKFPVHEFAITISIALRMIPTLFEETDKIILAQKARCADFDSRNLFKKAKAMLPVLVPLFVSSFKRADELAFAMDSRCYRGSKGRTKMKVLRLRVLDYISLMLVLLFLAAILFLRFNFFDWTFVSFLMQY